MIESTHEATLPIHGVHNKAIEITIFPDLTSSSLLSIGQLCNDDCTAIFTKKDIKVIKNNNVILEGTRNLNDGLWDVPIPTPSLSTEKANAIITKNLS